MPLRAFSTENRSWKNVRLPRSSAAEIASVYTPFGSDVVSKFPDSRKR